MKTLSWLFILLCFLGSAGLAQEVDSLPPSGPSTVDSPAPVSQPPGVQEAVRPVRAPEDSSPRVRNQGALRPPAATQTPVQNPPAVVADSLALSDSLEEAALFRQAVDSARRAREITGIKRLVSEVQQLLADHPYYNFGAEPLFLVMDMRQPQSDDVDFYFITALVLYLALVRLIFYKYISAMFAIFFRASLRHQQLREQMLQAPLPAFLMNLFFVITLAAYCTFLADHVNRPIVDGFGASVATFGVLIALIYIGKFVVLKAAGWVFNIRPAVDTYIFIVFLGNKVLGVLLLPVLVLMAFPTPTLFPVVLVCSYGLIGGMFAYRHLIAYKPLRSEIKLTRFHFFLYLCAFEIAPLLLIYKVLLEFVYSIFNL